MTLERGFSMASLMGVAFVLGWLSNSGYYNISQLWQQKNQLHVIQTKTLPKLQALAKCEHKRANLNEQIVDEAMVGKRPLPGDVAADCPHPVKP